MLSRVIVNELDVRDAVSFDRPGIRDHTIDYRRRAGLALGGVESRANLPCGPRPEDKWLTVCAREAVTVSRRSLFLPKLGR